MEVVSGARVRKGGEEREEEQEGRKGGGRRRRAQDGWLDVPKPGFVLLGSLLTSPPSHQSEHSPTNEKTGFHILPKNGFRNKFYV